MIFESAARVLGKDAGHGRLNIWRRDVLYLIVGWAQMHDVAMTKQSATLGHRPGGILIALEQRGLLVHEAYQAGHGAQIAC